MRDQKAAVRPGRQAPHRCRVRGRHGFGRESRPARGPARTARHVDRGPQPPLARHGPARIPGTRPPPGNRAVTLCGLAITSSVTATPGPRRRRCRVRVVSRGAGAHRRRRPAVPLRRRGVLPAAAQHLADDGAEARTTPAQRHRHRFDPVRQQPGVGPSDRLTRPHRRAARRYPESLLRL